MLSRGEGRDASDAGLKPSGRIRPPVRWVRRGRTSALAIAALIVGGSLVPTRMNAQCLPEDPARTRAPGFDPVSEDPARATKERAPRMFLELRLAENEPVRGLTVEATVKNTKRKIHVHYTTVATHVDIRKAVVVERGGRHEVMITLHPDRAAAIATATARHAGRPLAIVLDGEVTAVLTITKPLTGDIVFSADFTRDEAARIVSGLSRW